ncbi:pilin [Gilvimarinus sp. DA14]|uniref:pilin n=1 Tax=Gilvimarinus sp. DA14 TaxID=2956798 RepID=UPI0020B75C0F|nr:pilin [Gilvimarinus sp. DA14]UTF59167.1 pilin [Gilvimarinus sp. DA14]
MEKIRKISLIAAPLILIVIVYKWYEGKQQAQYGNIAYISKGINRSIPVRLKLEVYFAEKGKLPSSNEGLNLPSPESFSDNVLQSLKIQERGIIRLTFTVKSGVEGGTIDYIPTPNAATHSLEWQCVTSSFENIESWRPDCRFE